MRQGDVPQDPGACYEGFTRATYAVDSEGKYKKFESIGWEAEIFATSQAYEDRKHVLEFLSQKLASGKLSPLTFYRKSMQLSVYGLSRLTGVNIIVILIHSLPRFMFRIPKTYLQKYALALGVDELQLQRVNENNKN